METNNRSKEMFHENVNAAQKGFNDTNAAITDMYTKQLSLISGFYTNFFNSMMGANKSWGQDKGFMDMFQNNSFSKLFTNPFSVGANNFQNPFISMFQNNEMSKSFSNPINSFGNSFQNPFLTSVEKVYSQMADYNRNLFTAFSKENSGQNVDLNEISKKYKDTVDSRLEASKNMLKSATEAYNKQFDSVIESNKKMIEEINTQFSSVVKQTQKFWADILQVEKAPFTQEDPKVKEPAMNEFKKKANNPVTEFMDHKG